MYFQHLGGKILFLEINKVVFYYSKIQFVDYYVSAKFVNNVLFCADLLLCCYHTSRFQFCVHYNVLFCAFVFILLFSYVAFYDVFIVLMISWS